METASTCGFTEDVVGRASMAEAFTEMYRVQIADGIEGLGSRMHRMTWHGVMLKLFCNASLRRVAIKIGKSTVITAIPT